MFLHERDEYRKRLRNRVILLAGALVLAVDAMPQEQYDVGKTANTGDDAALAPSISVTGGLPLHLELPPALPAEAAPAGEPQRAAAPAAVGVPTTVLAAYQRAASSVTLSDPGCGLTWPVLAGIGRVESNHARKGNVTPTGDMREPIYGPELDGNRGTAAIRGDDGGWARAAGPMQFIPSTWAKWAADGSGDGRTDPQNVFDATLAAGRHLCAGNAHLSTRDGLRDAILRYNHSDEYARTVMAWISAYERGGWAAPDRSGDWSDATPSSDYLAVGPPPAPPAADDGGEPAPPEHTGGAGPPGKPTPPPQDGDQEPPGGCSGCGPLPGLLPDLRPAVDTGVVDVVGGTVNKLTHPLRHLPPNPVPGPDAMKFTP